ncbi:MAG: PBP1A family penicillin-binding protein [Candidatus Nealsonbacteria bacterium]
MARKKFKKWKLFLKAAGGAFFFFLLCFLLVFAYYAKDLPRPEVFTEKSLILPTKIYDREGKTLLYQIYDEEKRTVVALDQVSNNLKWAIIATEDSNFYKHFGIDPKGVARSIIYNLTSGRLLATGGSTISQQLIRSTFLTLDKTIRRKIKEIILTLELERRYSKDQILEFYLNQIPLGSNAYGVEAASQVFFNKPSSELSLAQAAAIASLIQAPSRLSPYGSNLDGLLARKNYVLSRMAQEGYISQEEADLAKKEVLVFTNPDQSIKAPHFVLYIKKYLEEKYSDHSLKEKGLKIYTTIDWNLQQEAEKIVQEGVKTNKAYNSYNASLVALNPQNGEILALVGSADWYATSSIPEGCSGTKEGCLFDPKFDIATLGERQPGSAFKPFAYAEAFKKGLTPETIFWDTKTEFNPNCTSTAIEEKDQYGMDCYHPANYTGNFKGPITLRNALAQSINIPAVKILYVAGLRNTIEIAQSFGISTLNQPLSWYGLSLVLGGGEVKLLDLVSAFGVFANNGLKSPPVSILKIEDATGNIIEENKKTPQRVLEANIANIINNILSDNEARSPVFGRNSLLNIPGQQVAVKTGTTQEFKDGWAIGYTPNIAVGVWVGNNNGDLMAKEPGVVLAGPIWNKFIRKAMEIYPANKTFQEINTAPNDTLILKEEDVLDKKDSQYQNWLAGREAWLNSN